MMNCDLVKDQLSAYIDHELDGTTCQAIDGHLARCDQCRSMAMEFRALGTLLRRSEPFVDTEAVWVRIADHLVTRPAISLSKESHANWRTKQTGFSILAVAASIALLCFSLLRNDVREHAAGKLPHDHGALAVDFGEVFRFAKAEPQRAIAGLIAKYQGRELSQVETSEYLGYEPALFRSVPGGFTRVSTHVLNMPCCKCSATICARIDGTALIVFEHKDEQPVWFGDSPSIETQCAGKSCKIIESAGQLAVSWKNQDRQLTMVGANDIAEVNQWVAFLKL